MDSHVKIKPMAFTGNVAMEWNAYKRRIGIHITATGRDNKDDAIKIAILLDNIGDEGIAIYDTFNLKKKPSYEEVIKAFDDFCIPRKNEVFESYKFNQIKQEENQLFDQFLKDLKQAATRCNYQDEERMIRDRIVMGTKDTDAQAMMLKEDELTLLKAIEICKIHEQNKLQMAKIHSNDSKVTTEIEIDALQRRNKGRYDRQAKDDTRTFQGRNQQCSRCGRQHTWGNCPAYQKKCSKCKKMNHFAAQCKATIHRVEATTEEDEFIISNVRINSDDCDVKNQCTKVGNERSAQHRVVNINSVNKNQNIWWKLLRIS